MTNREGTITQEASSWWWRWGWALIAAISDYGEVCVDTINLTHDY